MGVIALIIDRTIAKKFLRIDEDVTDDDEVVDVLIGAAETYLLNATGKQFDSTNQLARLFCLVLVSDWYENRSLIGVKVGEKVRQTVESMVSQLSNCPDPAAGGTV